MSLGMFCAIPLPVHVWDDACMNLMLPFFPFVGIVLGAIWWGIAELLVFSGIHLILASAVLAITPFFLTGFLHLDGYMDTSDAVLSRRPLEDKLRILKDPHTGAFSVIMVAVLFLLQFAAVYAILDREANLLLFVFIAVMARCCASLSILCLKPMAQSGYGNMFRQNIRAIHRIFLIAFAVLVAVLAYWFTGFLGLITVAAVIIGFIGAMAYSYKEFKGVSGDLTGYSLVIGELCGLIAMGVLPCF
jgi:adenosylcobinamide-GDP ribazoletransferase